MINVIIVLSDRARKSDNNQKGSGKANRTEEGGKMQDMGMTDKQFNGFVRFLLDAIAEVLEQMEEGKAKDKLEKVRDNLQQTLED